ncbi:MAG: (Fe-S)-binding protein [Chloroflexota bacterium]
MVDIASIDASIVRKAGMTESQQVQVQRVYGALPGKNCGLCGYGTCLRFARAIVEGNAPVNGCQQDPLAAVKIARILGSRDATNGSVDGHELDAGYMRAELEAASYEAEMLLARIERLRRALSA